MPFSKKIKKWHPVLFAVLAFSCSPVYLPNAVNTPLLSEEGEIQASAQINTSGTNVQFAYAPTDHLGLMINGNTISIYENSDYDRRRHIFGEAAAGYFQKLGKRGRFSAFGGLGFGNINPVNAPLPSFNFIRGFVQPSIGLKTDVFDFGASSRFSYVQFTDLSTGEGFFIEPALTAKLGYKNIKLMTQMGFSIPLSNIQFEHNPFIFGFGINAFLFKSQYTKE
jgi:hypothetical protein